MNKKLLNEYVSPYTKEKLTLEGSESAGDEILKGRFVSKNGDSFEIKDGVPLFLNKSKLGTMELKSQSDYDVVAEEFYDNAVDWLFESFHEDEDKVRDGMVDLLNLKPDFRVLEIGCGTGRDSFRIAKRLGPNGALYMQDLSPNMVFKTRKQFAKYEIDHNLKCETHYFVSDGGNLPFPDNFFDAIFHFGGFNEFSHQKESMAEFARITKESGKIVIGDEAIPPWLEGTEFAEIVTTNNAMFKHKAPLETVPVGARDVTVRWVLGGCFYLIEFKKGNGTPPLNLDLPHKGRRGGTMRTRYYGQLEGVSLQAKEAARKAAAEKGMSLHDWLNSAIETAARSK